MYHNFFIHSSAKGHLGCFQLPVIVNSPAMNTGVRVSFWIMAFSGIHPGMGLQGKNHVILFDVLTRFVAYAQHQF